MIKHKKILAKHSLNLIIAVIVIIIFIIAAFWISHHHDKQRAQRLSKKAIADFTALFQSKAPLNFGKLLAGLESTHQAKIALEDSSNTKIKTEIDKMQAIYLQRLFIPLLANEYMRAISEKMQQPRLIYPFLKAYVMLGNPNKIDQNYLAKVAQAVDASVKTKPFKFYLNLALHNNFTGIKLHPDLVSAARASFKTQPLGQQAFVILTFEHTKTQPVFPSAALAAFKPINNHLPSIYMGKQFQQVLKKQIPALCQMVLQGNWIIGPSQNSNTDINQLKELVTHYYLAAYINQWDGILLNLNLKPIHTKDALQDRLSTFSSEDSPLIDILRTIHENTNFQTINRISPTFANINKLFSATDKTLPELIALLDKAQDNSTIPLQLTSAPIPLNHWLTQLSTDQQAVHLEKALNQLNQQWQTLVANYQQTIAGHFPFAKAKTADVNLADFNAMFAPNGQLITFINKQLEPYINQNQATWTWKKLPGLTPANGALEKLQQAENISRMFFSSNAKQATVNFTLKPIAISPNTKHFLLNLNGQLVMLEQHNPGQTSNLAWTLQAHNQATISFIGANNKILSQKQTGPWAWLHLLSNAKITPVSDKSFYLTLSLGNNDVEYQLTTPLSFNPFNLKKLRELNLPKQLLT